MLHETQPFWHPVASSFIVRGMNYVDGDSLAVHAGREDLESLGVHAPPIDLSTTNPLPDIELGGDSYEALATGGRPIDGGSHVYARLWNPTVARFESALAQLEGADAAVAFASGMAAMTAAILATTRERSHIVAVRPLYGGSDHLLDSGLLGTEVSFCAEDEVAAAVRDDTGLVVIESPGNPSLELIDIAGVVGIDAKTLRKHYRDELDHGHVKANVRVAENLYRKATGEGCESVIAAIFWLKTRAGWRETNIHEIAGPRGGPVETPAGFGRAEVTHVDLNDDVVEGLACLDIPAFSVQYHPEAAAGPHDADALFDRFRDMVLAERTGGASAATATESAPTDGAR